MAIHPDDPPYNILAYQESSVIVKMLENSLSYMMMNIMDLHYVLDRLADTSKTFVEDNHLEGNVDMYDVMLNLIELNRPLPYRLDHGHRMLDDLNKKLIMVIQLSVV